MSMGKVAVVFTVDELKVVTSVKFVASVVIVVVLSDSRLCQLSKFRQLSKFEIDILLVYAIVSVRDKIG